MRKIVILLLFLLGAAEIVWSMFALIHFHGLEPPFARAFDASKFTAEQLQVLVQLQDTATAGWSVVALFGLVTILIAIFFWAAEIAKKPDA